MILSAVDAGTLVELVWAAALAGIVVTAAFALIILGLTRIADLRRSGIGGASATGYLALALLATAAFVGAVIFGVSVIVAK